MYRARHSACRSRGWRRPRRRSGRAAAPIAPPEFTERPQASGPPGALEPLRVAIVIPALNEEASLGRVIDDIPRIGPGFCVSRVVVVDNGSRDRTSEVAAAAGAEVLSEPRRGYGRACLVGIAWLRDPGRRPDVLAFLDGDYSDFPGELPRLLEPIVARRAELVIGSRVTGRHETGALLPQALFGNWLATRLVRAIWGARWTDLGPFRAIRWEAYERLGMADTNFGWTVEMQVKAARCGVSGVEVPVSYRKRIGKSKVSGTIYGTLAAGTKILWTIFREAMRPRG